MKKSLLIFVYCAVSTSLAFAQIPGLKGYTTYLPVSGPPDGISLQPSGAVNPIPTWNYSIVGYDGVTYPGSVVGRSPYSRGKTTTTIPVQIIPLVITIVDSNGTIVYDPTVTDACVTPGTHTPTEVITNSPIFQNTPWTMNGISMGTTQYIDAFQRSEFWSLVSGTPYHLMLSQTTLASQPLSFGTGGLNGIGANYTAAGLSLCNPVGVVQEADMDTAIKHLITVTLAASINVGTFPVFLTKNVVMTTSGTNLFGANCCILGYHSGITVGPNIQIYSPFSVDTAQAFGPGFVSTLAHEMGEAINDPNTNNQTPAWGNQGQQPACQGNFEVGDPLSPGGIAPTSTEFNVTGANGLAYQLQELAYFSWFFGGTGSTISTSGTSLGAGGKFSNNGAFSGRGKACPTGGTF